MCRFVAYMGAPIIVSEKLDNHEADWQLVPENYMLQVDPDLSTTLSQL